MASVPVTDPAYAHRLSEYIAAGRADSYISYKDLSFLNKDGNIIYTVKNVIEDYMYELKSMAKKVILSDDEFFKYKYKPQILAYDIYGVTEFYPFILMLNNMCNIREFTLQEFWLIPKTTLIEALSNIYTAEHADIETYNSNYE